MRLCNSLIISIITSSSASCTLIKAQEKRIDAFQSRPPHCGRPLVRYVTNTSIIIRAGQPPLTTTIRKLRLGAFGHICVYNPAPKASTATGQIIKDTKMSLSDAVVAAQYRPYWMSLVRDAPCPATQATLSKVSPWWWFQRGVREAIHIRSRSPTLNRDRGRHNLPSVYNTIVLSRDTRMTTAVSRDQNQS